MNTTNYYNTFIEVSADCPVKTGEIPPQKSNGKTVADLQFEMISNNPYVYTSDDVIFSVYAEKNKVGANQFDKQRELFFSKGQPCLRSSPLPKRYGWGVHSDTLGKIAIFPIDSEEYKNLLADSRLHHVKAMRSKR